ncbi:hypothetical protein LO772_05130 [Yinghuangia sp. ASG 101]|uniref:hypothetical protein n=1 Tax=Yinghuangia sp. ASG 101 TaxID=2896848 RepID=UPI001E46BD90|nr:hypothetical protein [Yinghuangia sp. ASG 101]UGQ13008.1 hypothetical protein LO772_05130 [Yinghuangia sp. ASG 101]
MIAPGVVLAAGHVACPNRDTGPVVIRELEGGAEHEAAVLWTDPSIDVALLRGDHTRLGAGLGIVRWGALTCDPVGARPVCTTIGFPQALHRKLPGGPRSAAQAQSLEGWIAPRGRARSGMYVFELAGPDDVSFDVWQGMSGAAVYCDDAVVGLATNAADYWRGETLLVLPAFRLLNTPGFADTVAAATGMRPLLRPADLAPLLTDSPDPQLSSSYLLDPAAQVVPVSGDPATARALREWCFNGRRTDVAALTGADGTGKTRMAFELLGNLARDVRGRPAWTGGFLAEVPRPTPRGYALFTEVRQPLLLIVDGAEARLDQVHALFDLLGGRRTGQPIRVLLIVRGRQDWWPRLRGTWTGSVVMGRGETFRVAASAAFTGTDPAPGGDGGAATGADTGTAPDTGAEAFYRRATAAFVERIRMLRDLGIDDDRPDNPVPDLTRPSRYTVPPGDAGLTVGDLHMAALADALARFDPELGPHRRPLDVLLGREESHVRRIAQARMPSGLVDSGLLRTLLAVQQLVGAGTHDDALGAVRAGFDVHNRGRGDLAQPQGPVLRAYEDILATAYPSGHGARWGAIGPEPLRAALVAEVEAAGDGAFLAALLGSPHLTALQRYRALALLVRSADGQPELVAAGARAVAAAPELLLPIAQWIPAEVSAERAREWLLLCRDAVTDHTRRGASPAHPGAWAVWTIDNALARLDGAVVAGEDDQLSPPSGVFVPRPRGPGAPDPADSAAPSGPDHAARTPGVRPRAAGRPGQPVEWAADPEASAPGVPAGQAPAAAVAGAARGPGPASARIPGGDATASAPAPPAPPASASHAAPGAEAPPGPRGTADPSPSASAGEPSGGARPTSARAAAPRATAGRTGTSTEPAPADPDDTADLRPPVRDRRPADPRPADPRPADPRPADPRTTGPRHATSHRARAGHRRRDRHRAHGLRPVRHEQPRPGPTRFAVTVVAVAYVALVVYAACDTFYVSGPFADARPAWILPPVVVFVVIEAGLQARHWRGPPEPSDLPAQLLAFGVATACGAMYAGNHADGLDAVVLALVAALVSLVGTVILTETTRRWLGQVVYVRDWEDN